MACEDQLFLAYRRTRRPSDLALVYDLVASELFDVALHLTGSPAEAEDALQETFTIAIERADAWDPKRRLLPWLLGILAHCARATRRRATRAIEPERLPIPASEDPSESAERRELADLLDTSLREIPAPFQSVLILRLRHGLSAPEIAHALRRPPGTVRSQLQRGLETLRRKLPASLAGVAFASLPTTARGLDAIRAAVVAHATSVQPIAAASLVGVLLMNKLLVGAAAAIALVAAVYFAPAPDSREQHELPVANAIDTAIESELDARMLSATPALASERARVDENRISPASTVSAKPTKGELLVRVVSQDDGRPASGIAVVASSSRATWSVPEEHFALTNDAGEALFADIPPGSVRARSPQGSEDEARVTAGERTVLTLRAFAGVVVAGRIVDAEDRAIGGAEVWLSERYATNNGHIVARADEQGRFELRSIGSELYIGARARSFAMSATQSVRGKPGDRVPLRIVLQRPGTSVRGRVVDRSGAPLAHAIVLIGDEHPRFDVLTDSGQWMPSPPPCRAVTMADGEYRADSVPIGPAPVLVRANGCAPWRGEIVVDDGGNVLDIVLDREAMLVGRVLDARGVAAPRAWVHTHDTNGVAASSAYAAGDGSFRLLGLSGGAQKIIAEDPKLGRIEHELVLVAGAVTERDFVLDAAPRIFGTVRDELDRPVAGVVVVAYRGVGAEARSRSTATGADGAYSISVATDDEHTVLVQPRDAWRGFPFVQVESVRADVVPFDIRLEARERSTATLRGTVATPDGRSEAGIEVAVWHESNHLWRSFPVDADSGEFEIEGVPPGDVSIDVQSASFPKKTLGTKQVAAGEKLDLGRIVLEQPTRLSVVFDGGDERALASLSVVLANEQRQWTPMIVHGPRTYRSAPLAPGQYQLRVQGDFVAPVVVACDVVARVERVEHVRLERAGLREVVLRAPPDAGALERVSCSVHAEGGRLVWIQGGVQPSADGTFAMRVSLPPGNYRVFATARGGFRGEAALTIANLDQGEPLVVPLALAETHER